MRSNQDLHHWKCFLNQTSSNFKKKKKLFADTYSQIQFRGHWKPVLDFWRRFLWVSKLVWALSSSHLWCYTCQPLDGHDGSWLLPCMHVSAEVGNDPHKRRRRHHCARDPAISIFKCTALQHDLIPFKTNIFYMYFHMVTPIAKDLHRFYRIVSSCQLNRSNKVHKTLELNCPWEADKLPLFLLSVNAYIQTAGRLYRFM